MEMPILGASGKVLGGPVTETMTWVPVAEVVRREGRRRRDTLWPLRRSPVRFLPFVSLSPCSARAIRARSRERCRAHRIRTVRVSIARP